MPRFVVLEHQSGGTHWDFMLESGGALRTWTLEAEPAYARSIKATQGSGHQPMSMDYAGEANGTTGQVRRFDAGTFEWLHCTDETADVRLKGSRLQGHLHLHRRRPEIWSFRLEKEKSGA